MVSVVAQIYVVNPHVRGAENRNRIFKGCWHFLMHCVTDDDIGCIHNREADADDFFERSAKVRRISLQVFLTATATYDRFVASNVHSLRTRDRTRDDYNARIVAGNGALKSLEGRHGDSRSTFPSGSATRSQ